MLTNERGWFGMACNIEVKARLLDLGKVESLARQLADSGPHLIEQQDGAS